MIKINREQEGLQVNAGRSWRERREHTMVGWMGRWGPSVEGEGAWRDKCMIYMAARRRVA